MSFENLKHIGLGAEVYVLRAFEKYPISLEKVDYGNHREGLLSDNENGEDRALIFIDWLRNMLTFPKKLRKVSSGHPDVQ